MGHAEVLSVFDFRYSFFVHLFYLVPYYDFTGHPPNLRMQCTWRVAATDPASAGQPTFRAHETGSHH